MAEDESDAGLSRTIHSRPACNGACIASAKHSRPCDAMYFATGA